jgi:TAG lipase/steryl ester hydrolase/phospholipase A2/LPA acyltransferase
LLRRIFCCCCYHLQALIWSAVAASSAFPGLFHPQDLLARNARGEEVR